jgi:O-antigen ligase
MTRRLAILQRIVLAISRLQRSSIAGNFVLLGRCIAAYWRLLVRGVVVLIGMALFVAAELLLSRGIINSQYYLVVVAIFAILYTLIIVRSPLAGFLVWIVISPLSAYFLEARFSGGWNFLTFDSVSFLLFFIVFTIKGMANRTQFRWPSVGEWLLIVFISYVLIAIVVRGDFQLNTLKSFFFRMGFWPFIYYFARASVKSEEDIQKIITAFMVSAAVISATLLYEHFWGQSIYSLVFHTAIPLHWEDVASGRAVGTFRTPIHSGQFLIPTIFFALNRMAVTNRRSTRYVCAAIITAAVAGIFFTYTRNNYASLLMCTLLVPVFSPNNRKFYTGVLVAFAIVLIGIIVPQVIGSSDLMNRMTKDTVSNRVIFMRTSIEMIKDNILFGVGWGNSSEMTSKYVVSRVQYEGLKDDMGMDVPTLVHNTYLSITQETGIIGAILYYGAVLACFFSVIRIYLSSPLYDCLGKNFLGVIIAFVLTWFVATMTFSNDIANYPNAMFWIYFALAGRYGEILANKLSYNHNKHTPSLSMVNNA